MPSPWWALLGTVLLLNQDPGEEAWRGFKMLPLCPGDSKHLGYWGSSVASTLPGQQTLKYQPEAWGGSPSRLGVQAPGPLLSSAGSCSGSWGDTLHLSGFGSLAVKGGKASCSCPVIRLGLGMLMGEFMEASNSSFDRGWRAVWAWREAAW